MPRNKKKRERERKFISNKAMQQENKNANQKNFREKFSQGKKIETEGIYNMTLESELNKHSNTQKST